jgi:hypothetical protein
MNLVEMPLLAADLTFANLRHGRVYSAMSDWEEDREPMVGETVLVVRDRHLLLGEQGAQRLLVSVMT